jgi:hypothetical protein
MSILAVDLHAQARNVNFTDDSISVELLDGRTISAPLIWFPRLLAANNHQRKNWQLMGDGEGIHWPDIDEDLSIAGLLAGAH